MRAAGDRGSVTAELAAALPVLVLLLLAALSGVAAVAVKLRCVDAAAQAAGAAARDADGVAAGRRAGPEGAAVSVGVDGVTVRAVVRAPIRPLGAGVAGFTVECVAVSTLEPGAGGAGT